MTISYCKVFFLVFSAPCFFQIAEKCTLNLLITILENNRCYWFPSTLPPKTSNPVAYEKFYFPFMFFQLCQLSSFPKYVGKKPRQSESNRRTQSKTQRGERTSRSRKSHRFPCWERNLYSDAYRQDYRLTQPFPILEGLVHPSNPVYVRLSRLISFREQLATSSRLEAAIWFRNVDLLIHFWMLDFFWITSYNSWWVWNWRGKIL